MASLPQRPSDLLKYAAATTRPLIHHINADNSWLLQLPRLDNSPRPFFNILLDPWLTGFQEEFTRWFHRQGHTELSAFQTIAEIELYVREIEDLACELRGIEKVNVRNGESRIDAVACTTMGTDHVNKATLMQLPPSVPILVRPEGVAAIRSWGHFEVVEGLAPFEADWRETKNKPLPEWIGIGSLTQPKDLQGIHKGLLISFDIGNGSAESVIFTPHGILLEDLTIIPKASPDLRVLALLHGTLNVKVGWYLTGYMDANLGAHNGLKVQRLTNAKYWIGTHDESKVEQGFTSLMLSQFPITVEEALERERMESGGEDCGRETGWHYMGNGASLVLT